jgi:hypothetical protein
MLSTETAAKSLQERNSACVEFIDREDTDMRKLIPAMISKVLVSDLAVMQALGRLGVGWAFDVLGIVPVLQFAQISNTYSPSEVSRRTSGCERRFQTQAKQHRIEKSVNED